MPEKNRFNKYSQQDTITRRNRFNYSQKNELEPFDSDDYVRRGMDTYKQIKSGLALTREIEPTERTKVIMDMFAPDKPIDRPKDFTRLTWGWVTGTDAWKGWSSTNKSKARDIFWNKVILPQTTDMSDDEVRSAAFEYLRVTNKDILPRGLILSEKEDPDTIGDPLKRGIKNSIDYFFAHTLRGAAFYADQFYGLTRKYPNAGGFPGMGVFVGGKLLGGGDSPYKEATEPTALWVERSTQSALNPDPATGDAAGGIKGLGDFGSPRLVYQAFAEGTPTLVAFMASNAISAGATSAMLLAAETGSVLKEMDDYEANTGLVIPPHKRLMVAVGVGAVNAALEKTGLDALVGKGVSKTVSGRMMKWLIGFSIEDITEGLQGGSSKVGQAIYDELENVGAQDVFAETWTQMLNAAPVAFFGAGVGHLAERHEVNRQKKVEAVQAEMARIQAIRDQKTETAEAVQDEMSQTQKTENEMWQMAMGAEAKGLSKKNRELNKKKLWDQNNAKVTAETAAAALEQAKKAFNISAKAKRLAQEVVKSANPKTQKVAYSALEKATNAKNLAHAKMVEAKKEASRTAKIAEDMALELSQSGKPSLSGEIAYTEQDLKDIYSWEGLIDPEFREALAGDVYIPMTTQQMAELTTLQHTLEMNDPGLDAFVRQTTRATNAAMMSQRDTDIVIDLLSAQRARDLGVIKRNPKLQLLNQEEMLWLGDWRENGSNPVNERQLDVISTLRRKILNGEDPTDSELDELKWSPRGVMFIKKENITTEETPKGKRVKLQVAKGRKLKEKEIYSDRIQAHVIFNGEGSVDIVNVGKEVPSVGEIYRKMSNKKIKGEQGGSQVISGEQSIVRAADETKGEANRIADEKSDTASLFASIRGILNDDAGFIDSELLGSKLIVLAVQKIRSVAIKFAEWSSQMVAEFGIKIKPYLVSAWKQAQLMIKDSDIDLIVTTSQAKKDLDGYSDRIDWVLDGIELDDADKEGLRLDVEYLKQLAKKRQGSNFENQMDALKSVVVSPRGILKKLTAGKLFYKFVDYTHQSIGVIAGRPIKMLDAASDKLSSRDQIAMINRFKSWYERGAPDEKWVTQEIREWEKTYSAVMQYLGNLGDTAKILVRVKVRVGTIIAQQMHQLKELEQRRDRGEEGLNRAIRGARQSMDYWKKQSQAGIKYTNDPIYEPLGKHLRKNYFTHILTGDARTVLMNGRGEAFEAIQKMCIETGISIDDLRQASDPMSFNEDKKNSAMEEMRTANLPESLKYGKGKSLHLLETNPFTVANHYVMGAARRIATATAIRSVPGYDATIYPHYRTAINRFIEDLQAGVLAEGGGAANVNLMMGVWHNLMGSRLQSKGADGHLSNALRPLKPIYRASESVARTAMLTMSNITNAIGGWYPIMANRGIANTLKGLVFTGTEKLGHVKAKQMLGFSMDMMGYQKNMLSHLGETGGLDQKTAELAKDTLRGLGFEMANRTLNKAASIAAIYWLDEIVTKMRRGHKNSLFYRSVLKRELQYNDSQIDRMIIDGVTAKDLALIIQQTVEMVNVYRENPGNVPPWMKTEMGVTVMALNSFNRKMGQNLANGIWEARQGNPRKLATLLLGGYVSQIAIIALKNMLNDRDDNDEWWVKGYMTMLMSGSLGLQGAYASDLAWAYRLDMNTMETLTTLAMPPTWGWMVDFTGDFANAIIKLDKKHFDKLSKDVPIFKMIAANSYRMIEGKWHTDYNTYRKRGSRKKRSGDMVKNIRRGSQLTQGKQP